MKKFFILLDRLKFIFNLKVDYSLRDIKINDVTYITDREYVENKERYNKEFYTTKMNHDVVALLPLNVLPTRLLSQIAESHHRRFKEDSVLLFIEEIEDEKLLVYVTSNYEVFNNDSFTSFTISKEVNEEDLNRLDFTLKTFSFASKRLDIISKSASNLDFLSSFENYKFDINILPDYEVSKLMIRTKLHENTKNKLLKTLLILLAIFTPSYLALDYGNKYIKNEKKKLEIKISNVYKDINKINNKKKVLDIEIQKLEIELKNFKGIHYDN